MSETCPICCEVMEGESNTHTLECKHKFHTGCIMKWFRQGASTCPTCRDKGGGETSLSYMDILDRASYLRRVARRKNAPKELKRVYKKLLDAEKKEKHIKKELQTFRNENKELEKSFKLLRNKRWRAGRKVSQATRILGLLDCEGLRVPVVVPRRRRRGDLLWS